MVDTEYLMAQAVADAVGATKRQIQIWTDAGAIDCLPETDRQGRGRQRLYDKSELPIAALIAYLARYKLPIGSLQLASIAVREFLNDPDIPQEDREWARAALKGDIESYMVFSIMRHKDPRRARFTWRTRDQLLGILENYDGQLIVNVRKVIAPLTQ